MRWKFFPLAACLLFVFGFSVRPYRSVDDVCLSKEEQKLYSLMMDYRKSKRLPPIPLSKKLTQVAKAHVHDLATSYTFDPGSKCNPHSWSKNEKWSACCYTADHKQAKCMWDKPKEIAGYASPGFEIAYFSSAGANAEEGLAGWKKSPAHNPLIVNEGMWKNAKWQAVGMAFEGSYGVVWFGEIMDDEIPCREQ